MSSSTGSSAKENGPKPQHLLLLNNSWGPRDATPASDYFCLRCSQTVNSCSRCQLNASSQHTSQKCVGCFNHQMFLLGFNLKINPALNKRGTDQQSSAGRMSPQGQQLKRGRLFSTVADREPKLQLLKLKQGLHQLLLNIRVKI